MKIETITISELRPYEKNARTHPKGQIELLKNNDLVWYNIGNGERRKNS